VNTPQWPSAGQAAHRRTAANYPLVPAHCVGPGLLSLDNLAYRSGVHPQLISRFVALGLVEASRDESGRLWFSAAAPATIARIQRLRAGLSLNYASLGLVLDLLDRIDQLEAALRRSARQGKERTPWI
jgi:chaperone modulatory protein CbpM